MYHLFPIHINIPKGFYPSRKTIQNEFCDWHPFPHCAYVTNFNSYPTSFKFCSGGIMLKLQQNPISVDLNLKYWNFEQNFELWHLYLFLCSIFNLILIPTHLCTIYNFGVPNTFKQVILTSGRDFFNKANNIRNLDLRIKICCIEYFCY